MACVAVVALLAGVTLHLSLRDKRKNRRGSGISQTRST
jgi:hypothetical protein